MKTNDFIKQVTDMGYKTYQTKYWISVIKDNIGTVTEVSRTVRYGMSIVAQRRHPLTQESIQSVPEELVDLTIEYARTPINERE